MLTKLKIFLLISSLLATYTSKCFNIGASPDSKIDSLMRKGREHITDNPEKARKILSEAYELSVQADLLKEEANALNYLGLTWYNQEKYEESIKYFQKSLKVLFQIGSKNQIANMMKKIGISYLNLERYSKAIEYYTFAVKIYDQTGFMERKAQTLIEIGVIQSLNENYSKASVSLDSALSIFTATHNKSGITQTLNQLGLVYDKMNNYNKASEHYQNALKIYEEHMDYNGVTIVLNNYGKTLMKMRRFEEAKSSFEKALKHCDPEKKALYTQIIANLAEVEIDLKDYEDASIHLEEAKTLVDSIQEGKVKAQVYRSLYELSMHQNNPKNALEFYQQYIQMKDNSGDGKKKEQDHLNNDSPVNNFAITVTVLAVIIIMVLVIWLIIAIKQRDKAVNELKKIQHSGMH